MTRAVLFVCLGNICRSPSAEGVLRAMARDARLRLDIDSAGTGAWHIGKPPFGPAVAAAAARGYDIGGQRARQVGPDDFRRFDLIVGMDTRNLADLARLRPAGDATPLHRLLDFAPETGFADVPDPYFTGDFNGALDLIEAGARGLLAHLNDQGAAAGRG